MHVIVHGVHCRGTWLYEQKNLHLAHTICLSYSIYNIFNIYIVHTVLVYCVKYTEIQVF